MSDIQHCPEKDLPYVEFDGHKRYLASIPSAGKMKAALPNYTAAGNPVLPRSEWFELSRRDQFASWIFDQNGHGSCVGNGWTGGLMRARALAGCKPVVLSPGWTYSLINGNRDSGAVISDGIQALTQVGTCLFSTVGQDPIYQRQMPSGAKAEAARYRIKAAYHCTSWEEVISALLLPKPMIPVYGYQVGRSFGSFDKYGVAGHDRGPGNHCNHADGVKLLPDGRWVLDDVNSWNARWGPWGNGRAYLDENHLFGGGDQADVCVIEAFVDDPQEPNDPPVAG
ncbi:MAG: cysteine protease [Gemmataceae bacterium]|nr:cysteine protease [Gemmataceae bacterium]